MTKSQSRENLAQPFAEVAQALETSALTKSDSPFCNSDYHPSQIA